MVLKQLLCGYSNLSLRYITQWRARQNKTSEQHGFFFSMAAYAMGIICLAQLGLCGVLCQNVLPANYGVKVLEVSERAGCALDNLVQSFHIAVEGIPTRYMYNLIAARG